MTRPRGIFDRTPLRIAALLLLLTSAAIYESFRTTALLNNDVWWHLRTGLWILQKHAFPRVGLFSQYPDRPWVASSWGFDALIAVAYRLLGLKALPTLLMVFKLALAAITFLLARGWRGKFWFAILLSATAQFALVELPPLPILFSILFFGTELLLLLESRRAGDARPLFCLPFLFFLWANLHGQFLNGLLLLGLYLAAEVTEFLLRRPATGSFSPPVRPLTKVAAIAGLSAVATVLNPYSFHIFSNAFQTEYGKARFEDFAEMQALAFRQPQHFVFLLLVMAAFLAFGRQRSRDLFKLGTMAIFTMLAFRVQRDLWCAALPAIAIIADALAGRQQKPEARRLAPSRFASQRWEVPVAAALALAVLLAAIVRLPSGNALLLRAIRVFPARASDFIRASQLPGPLFNTYSWGGFLIWYLPEYPTAIDGRLNLYGDEINDRYFKVIAGAERLETDPEFTRARIVLLERNAPIAKALTMLPALRAQFRVVYEDEIAIVLVRQ